MVKRTSAMVGGERSPPLIWAVSSSATEARGPRVEEVGAGHLDLRLRSNMLRDRDPWRAASTAATTVTGEKQSASHRSAWLTAVCSGGSSQEGPT